MDSTELISSELKCLKSNKIDLNRWLKSNKISINADKTKNMLPIKYYSSVSGGLREAKAGVWV